MIAAKPAGAMQEQQRQSLAAFPYVERNIRQIDGGHGDCFLPCAGA